jgi:Na+/proline symporter
MTEPIFAVIQILGGWDYAVIAFFAVLMASLSIICRKLNKNPSDYFRGGGNMLWWVGGISAMATAISAWSFTGAAAKCYNDGFLYPATLVAATLPAIMAMWFIAPRFRRLRVITAMEGVFRRFGMGTEQFYTWFTLPMGLFWGGIGLNTIGVFMAGVFRMDVATTVLVFGALLTFVAVLGGQWALSFFAVVQGVLLVLVVITVAVLSLLRPEIGGLANLPAVLPDRHLNFAFESSGALVTIWFIYQVLFWALGQMDLRNSGKFVRVKDDSAARRMVLVMFVPSLLLLPVLMQLPAICAAVVFPDLAAVFPMLKSPAEGAWLAMALTVLPQGLIGLMVAVMFGATADSTDAALNSNAGFFTRNVYARYIRPHASAGNQVMIGKIITGIFGIITIGVALAINSLRNLNLFDLFQILNAMLLPPMIVPMVLGVFIKRTPDWSGWSTVVAGLVAAVTVNALYSAEAVQSLIGLDRVLSLREVVESKFIIISTATWGVSILWFLSTRLLWEKSRPEHRERIETLFDDLARPVNHMGEGGEDQDSMQYRVVGGLFLLTGGALMLGALIPNPLYGRIIFMVIGGILLLMGLAFLRLSRSTPEQRKGYRR